MKLLALLSLFLNNFVYTILFERMVKLVITLVILINEFKSLLFLHTIRRLKIKGKIFLFLILTVKFFFIEEENR